MKCDCSWPMWSNLHGYIEMSLKYIFVFINEEKTYGEDFLIFENPEDAGMSGLLNSHEDAETKQTLSHETERRVYSNIKYVNEEISYNRAYYHDHIAGIRRIIYNTYHDVIKENVDTKFEVIHIPFTMSLYRKIMNLAQNGDDVPDLNTEEVCILLTHLSLFDEYAKASIAYAVCMHLLKNTELFNYVKNYTNTNDNRSDSPLKYLSLFLFSKNDVSTQLKKTIKSYINFALWDKYENPSKIYSKSKIYCYHSCNIDPGNFSLAFFFDRLVITYQWLEKNQTILDTKFKESLGDSHYSVYIHNFSLENRDANIVDITMNNLKIVTTSKFLTSENIDELTLEFTNLSNRMDLSCLSKIKASIFVICDFCSLDFIRSIPEYIKVSMRVIDDQPVHILNNIPENVVEITFRSVNFHESIVFPSHIRRITLHWCNVDPYACFTINEECQNIEIFRTQVQIIFPQVIECDLWHPLLMEKIKFS
ncbi:putative LRR containing protein [Trachipleistophora hominis]|uniref:Putative LRR containing protein n=1 Tax=Trachipleistophora hominis TaxID=72359 RepID=L7JUW9_TRAHO|nr:putative LRR containing protein [Trachipleistophora hominis]